MVVDQEHTDPIGTAIVLAAGAASRFGSDKRLVPFAGTTLLQHTVKRYSRVFHKVIVVLREDDQFPVEFFAPHVIPVYTSQAQLGISQSLRAGVQSAIQEPWLVIGLMDMPYVNTDTLQVLAQRMEGTTASIVRLKIGENYGNPVGFKQDCFSQLCKLTGDQGARTLIASGTLNVEELKVNDRGILVDIDTPEQLQEYGDL